MTLEFHVTNQIFKQVKNNCKTHEYRDYKEYWQKRLLNSKPKNAYIVKGYTTDRIPIEIVSIDIIPKKDVPVEQYKDYISISWCFDIHFRINTNINKTKKRGRCDKCRKMYPKNMITRDVHGRLCPICRPKVVHAHGKTLRKTFIEQIENPL